MVSVGFYEPPFSTMLPGHNGFGGPFYSHTQYHQDYFPQHFSQPFGAEVNPSQSWHLPYQSSRNTTTSTTTAPSCPEWSFPQTSNFLNTNTTTQTYRDSCLELEQPITVNTDNNLPGSPQSAIISSTHSPGENSPKSCSRYTCYDWVKSRPDRVPSPSDPLPNKWKTRTKDKYRVVYTDRQRLELEKEFHYSRYITINRKAELSKTLDLSERQIKIWFQNRRAKERKINKKKGGKQQSDEKEPVVSMPSLPVSMPMQGMASLPGQSMTSLRREDQYTPVGSVMGYQPPHPINYHGTMMHNMNLGYGAVKSSLDLNSGFVKAEYPHQ